METIWIEIGFTVFAPGRLRMDILLAKRTNPSMRCLLWRNSCQAMFTPGGIQLDFFLAEWALAIRWLLI
jgi:hypothetical protein